MASPSSLLVLYQENQGQVVDLMEVLKQSLEKTKKTKKPVREKTVAARTTRTPKKARAKKKA